MISFSFVQFRSFYIMNLGVFTDLIKKLKIKVRVRVPYISMGTIYHYDLCDPYHTNDERTMVCPYPLQGQTLINSGSVSKISYDKLTIILSDGVP